MTDWKFLNVQWCKPELQSSNDKARKDYAAEVRSRRNQEEERRAFSKEMFRSETLSRLSLASEVPLYSPKYKVSRTKWKYLSERSKRLRASILFNQDFNKAVANMRPVRSIHEMDQSLARKMHKKNKTKKTVESINVITAGEREDFDPSLFIRSTGPTTYDIYIEEVSNDPNHPLNRGLSSEDLDTLDSFGDLFLEDGHTVDPVVFAKMEKWTSEHLQGGPPINQLRDEELTPAEETRMWRERMEARGIILIEEKDATTNQIPACNKESGWMTGGKIPRKPRTSAVCRDNSRNGATKRKGKGLPPRPAQKQKKEASTYVSSSFKRNLPFVPEIQENRQCFDELIQNLAFSLFVKGITPWDEENQSLATQFGDMFLIAAEIVDSIYPGNNGAVVYEADPFQDEDPCWSDVNGLFTEGQDDFDPSLFITPRELAAYTKDEEMVDYGGEMDPYDEEMEEDFSMLSLREDLNHPGAEYTRSPAVWGMMMKMDYQPGKGLGCRDQGSPAPIDPPTNNYRFGHDYIPSEEDIQ